MPENEKMEDTTILSCPKSRAYKNQSKQSKFRIFPAISVYMKYSDRPASSQGATSHRCSFWLSALSPL